MKSRIIVVVVAVTAGFVGCGGGGSSDTTQATTQVTTQETQPATTQTAGGGSADAGKSVFTSNCGGCHTLADAGTTGSVGPNLDSLKPSFDRVRGQVQRGGGAMPAFGNDGILTPTQLDDVSAYVSSVAGS